LQCNCAHIFTLYIHTYLHTYIHTYRFHDCHLSVLLSPMCGAHTHIHTYKQTCIFTHTYKHMNIHTYRFHDCYLSVLLSPMCGSKDPHPSAVSVEQQTNLWELTRNLIEAAEARGACQCACVYVCVRKCVSEQQQTRLWERMCGSILAMLTQLS